MQVIGGHLVLTCLRDATSLLEVRTLDGALVRAVALPGLGTVAGMVGNDDEDEAYFTYSSFTEVPQVYRTSIASGATELWARVDFPVDTSRLAAEQVWYASRDGTRVSMFILHRAGLAKDGSAPAVLYGYGGFNVSLTPAFGPGSIPWLEAGGLLAIPNLRGGGEYGEDWHRAGMLERKQNVFDDFIAAAGWRCAAAPTAASWSAR
jgi:prolyl oligopeptidase